MTESATAVVVNWNGRDYVHEAVESLLRQDLPDLEVVVVDNASRDGSDRKLEERFGARLHLIRNDRNLGWGAGNNVAIRATRAPYVILLNSDARAEPAFARELVAAAGADPRVGMVAAKVLDHDRPDAIDTVGHLLYPDGLNRGRGRLEVDRGQYDAGCDALFPSGAAALYRREMLEEIGLFDEAFFLYGDDAELGLRGRLAGWSCAFAPRAVARHRYSASAGAYSSLKAFHVERNRVWLLLKLLPWSWIVASPAYTALRLALQAWGGITGRGAAGRLAAERSVLHLGAVTLKAWASAAGGVPRVLGERARVVRRLSPGEFRALLAAHRLTAREVALKE
ncbi:MAG TPA: glycosyltransferase family 2 protein [Vicinamibacteria bacterium]|nr:glycosyltransferase family 2 protein [Vicinamibacteria bacterium]